VNSRTQSLHECASSAPYTKQIEHESNGTCDAVNEIAAAEFGGCALRAAIVELLSQNQVLRRIAWFKIAKGQHVG
jgi:hypothetical protein